MLKGRLKLCIIKHNGQCRYNYLVLSRDKSYIAKNINLHKMFFEADIIKMFDFVINNMFLFCLVDAFFKTIAISIGTNFAPLLVDLFLYSYEADAIHEIHKKNEKKLTRSFNFTFHYRDGILLRIIQCSH